MCGGGGGGGTRSFKENRGSGAGSTRPSGPYLNSFPFATLWPSSAGHRWAFGVAVSSCSAASAPTERRASATLRTTRGNEGILPCARSPRDRRPQPMPARAVRSTHSSLPGQARTSLPAAHRAFFPQKRFPKISAKISSWAPLDLVWFFERSTKQLGLF